MKKIGFSFYGSIYKDAGKVSSKDFRHCWSNLYQHVVLPFIKQGHSSKILFSCYPLNDEELEHQFHNLVKPDKVRYSEYNNSTAFTCKEAAFHNFMSDEDLDVIVFTRSDLHFSRIMANENIKFDKFNFLFPEQNYFDSQNFTCDNFYVFPQKMSDIVYKAMKETCGWPRAGSVDTHGLLTKLNNYISTENINFISNVKEFSDVNSFYTICREGLPTTEERMKYCHPDVLNRFYKT